MTETISRSASSANLEIVNLEIVNARLPGRPGWHRLGIDPDGSIESIRPMDAEMDGQMDAEMDAQTGAKIKAIARPKLDVAGDWISLAGVDLQINGALGKAFPDLEPADGQKLAEICQFLWQHGVDGFLPTIVTTAVEKIQRALSAFSSYSFSSYSPAPESDRAQVLGVHLEGPFLNSQKRGAHPAQYLLPLTIENVKRVLGDYASLVKVITLAPELDVTGEAIPYLRSLGIVVSLGHSMATAAEARLAFDRGATMVTHAFNAMPPLHHRQPGLLAEAILSPGVQCGLIADGEHVCPTMVDLLLRASKRGSKPSPPAAQDNFPWQEIQNNQNIFLVSDALAPIGLADGIYPWDNREISTRNGTARLLDGTLAGTTEPLFSGVRNLVEWGVCEVGEAIALATESPRRAIGLPGMGLGQKARLLRWHIEEATATLTWERLLYI